MKSERILVPRLGESYYKTVHSSGLTVCMCPMEGYSTMYAQMTARYGSLDTSFRTDTTKDFLRVPEGIAHFLEHKLFEDDDGDAFMKFSRTGANANAFTSFDRTSYEVLCTDAFKENLEILVHMVSTPYFTAESVEKEQGIIAQEIQMYQDNPDWRVYFNLLRAMYHNHPITIDIAGTVESIQQIDKDLLYSCYHTFYNPHNMVLSVAGNFDPDMVLSLCDKLLKPSEAVTIQRESVEEPQEIKKELVKQSLPISTPMFEIGFKNRPYPDAERRRRSAANDILLEILAGEGSPLFSRLYDTGLITDSFDYEGIVERQLCCNMFSGEAKEPQAVLDELLKEIALLKKQGIAEEDFLRAKKFYYGKLIMAYNEVESIANVMTNSFVDRKPAFEILEILEELRHEEVEEALRYNLNPENIALSIIEPAGLLK